MAQTTYFFNLALHSKAIRLDASSADFLMGVNQTLVLHLFPRADYSDLLQAYEKAEPLSQAVLEVVADNPYYVKLRDAKAIDMKARDPRSIMWNEGRLPPHARHYPGIYELTVAFGQMETANGRYRPG